MKALVEESFKTFKQVNKMKLTFIECSLVIFFYYFHDFQTFHYLQLSALSSSKRQNLLDYEECFCFAGQIRLRAIHNNIENFQKILPFMSQTSVFSEVVEIAVVASRLGQFLQLLKTRVILILNFSRPHAMTKLIIIVKTIYNYNKQEPSQNPLQLKIVNAKQLGQIKGPRTDFSRVAKEARNHCRRMK